MNNLQILTQYLKKWSLVVLALLVIGCEDRKVQEPTYPSQEQLAQAMDELLKSTPEKELPIAIGPAIENILASKEHQQPGANYPESSKPGILEFQCGTRACACAEGENIPDDRKDEWLCDGMGAACTDKGFVPKFPCRVTSVGVTVCVCIHPDGVFK